MGGGVKDLEVVLGALGSLAIAQPTTQFSAACLEVLLRGRKLILAQGERALLMREVSLRDLVAKLLGGLHALVQGVTVNMPAPG